MPIDDVDVRFSHGWWFKRLAAKQAERYPKLVKLHERYTGQAPMPTGPKDAEQAFRAFQNLARTSYEDTIVRAVLDRQNPVGFLTAAQQRNEDGTVLDEGGDDIAAQVWASSEMVAQASEILEDKLSLTEGLALVMPPDEFSGGNAVITAEDPRQMIAAVDPAHPSRTRAALKVYYDPDFEQEVAYVLLRGGVQRPDGSVTQKATVRRAVRRKAKSSSMGPQFRLSPKAWDWEPEPSWRDDALELGTSRCPVVVFPNRRGLAEFEKHIDLIDRIRHTILQRMVIITMQAFRQRAVKGLPDRYPNDYPVESLRGQAIDYSGLFTADPAAVWLLPPGVGDKAVEIWESGELRIEGVLNAVKDDIREMASVTRTPFYEFVPDSANQTAEGASVQREGITYKVEDHNGRDGVRFAQVMSIAFEHMEQTDRVDVSKIKTLWAPVERHSLAEMADAAQKAKGLRSRRAILTDIYQKTPDEADRELQEIRDEAADDLLMAVLPNPAGGEPVRVDSTRTDQPAGGLPGGGQPPAIDAAGSAA